MDADGGCGTLRASRESVHQEKDSVLVSIFLCQLWSSSDLHGDSYLTSWLCFASINATKLWLRFCVSNWISVCTMIALWAIGLVIRELVTCRKCVESITAT